MKNTTRNFSNEQLAYMAALAAYEVAKQDRKNFDSNVWDVESRRLGLGAPYAILPENHPLWAEAERLLDAETAALDVMRTAAAELFTWGAETAIAQQRPTKDQAAAIRAMVEKVKRMAHIETPYKALVDLNMRLAA